MSRLFSLAFVVLLGVTVFVSTDALAKPKIEKLHVDSNVKVVKITLAPGGVLPTHTTPVHATVASLSGTGSVTIGDKTTPLAAHGVVFLPKKIPHAVTNTGKGPLVLLVHHLLTTK